METTVMCEKYGVKAIDMERERNFNANPI